MSLLLVFHWGVKIIYHTFITVLPIFKKKKYIYLYIRLPATPDCTTPVTKLCCQDGTTHLVWMVGGGPLFSVEGLLVSQARSKGMQRVQLLKPEWPHVQLPDKVSKIEVLADKVNVPAEETTYWCHVMKIPLDLTFKHHIVRVNTRPIFI